MNGAGTSHEVKSVSGPSTIPSKMVRCAGQCGRRRSIGQFAAGSTVCMQCVLRMPRVAA